MTGVPFDFAATGGMPDWRERLRWPVSVETLRKTASVPGQRLRAYCRGLAPRERDIVLLASPYILAAARYCNEVALSLAAAAAAGIEFTTDDPFVALATGQSSANPTITGTDAENVELPKFAALRRLVRTASWTRAPRLLPALLAPAAIAITHNNLLSGEARRRDLGVKFHQAEDFLWRARRRARKAPRIVDTQPIVDLICVGVPDDTPGGKAIRGFLNEFADHALGAAENDLLALEGLPGLPLSIWSGTGGKWSSRAVGLAALARGGRVTRFDHGATGILSVDPTHLVLTELSVSSTFVVPTDMAARLVTRNLGETRTELRDCNIDAAAGDPKFRSDPALEARPTPSIPRVLYPAGILRGARQFHHALLPDPIYLDWQLRVAEALQGKPVDLLCKPHPHGLLRGQTHPLAAVAPTSSRLFEDEMAETDIFLFDFPQSTTFWSALCTEKPVILLDFGLLPPAPEVVAAIAERATVIPLAFDDRNLPIVPAGLAEILLSVSGTRHDPSYFRSLLVGP